MSKESTWYTSDQIRIFSNLLFDTKPLSCKLTIDNQIVDCPSLLECWVYHEACSFVDYTWDELRIDFGSGKWQTFIKALHREGWNPSDVSKAIAYLYGHEVAPEGSLTLCSDGLGGSLMLADTLGGLTIRGLG